MLQQASKGVRSIAMTMSACLFVCLCLSVCLLVYLENYRAELYQILCER